MKRLRLLFALVLVGAAVAVITPIQSASASTDCPVWVDSETATECVVSSSKSPGPGPWTFGKTLLVTGTGHIDATDSPTGITLNIDGNPGIDLVMEAGAIIETDDDHLPGNNTGAPPITITVANDLVMAAGSRISADNLYLFGPGGDINITVGGDMKLGGTPGIDNCTHSGSGQDFGDPTLIPNVYDDPTLGAVISAVRRGGNQANVAPGGNITITVGNKNANPPVGTFEMERCSLVDVSSKGTGGEIIITAGNAGTIHGLVLSHAGLKSTYGKGGGPITIITGCSLFITDTGVVSSHGRDPGADLVHLESCDVTIFGLVQSTVIRTGGHGDTPQVVNRCEDDPIAHPLGAAPRFTGCVEVWAKNILIDAAAHHGNINTDRIVRNRGWIDLFAANDIRIVGGPIGSDIWAVSTQSATGAPNQKGGLVTIKAVEGKVTASGQAVRSDAPTNGSTGGQIIVESGGDGAAGVIDLSNAQFDASSGGGNAVGGSIAIKAFNSNVTSGPQAKLDASAKSNQGSITVTTCANPAGWTGQSTPLAVIATGVCGAAPTLPAPAQNQLAANALIWALCAPPPCP